jgi:pimeloyl-ACP methyl ester carboxylesterase
MSRCVGISLAIFQGINQSEPTYYEEDIAGGFVDFCESLGVTVNYKIFSPPMLRNRERAWAEYGTGVNRDTADLTEIGSRVEVARAWIVEQDRPCALVGISNGCVAAGEVAILEPDKVNAIAFVSGMPEWSQVKKLQNTLKTSAATFTVGSKEQHWDGGKLMYDAAYTLGADVLAFAGKHCKEGVRLCKHVGARTALLALWGREDSLWPGAELRDEDRYKKRRRFSECTPSSSNDTHV